MKFLVAAMTTFFTCAGCFSQDPVRIDSLNKVFAASHNDIVTGLTALELAEDYVYTKTDSCLYFANIGFDLLKEPIVQNQLETATENTYEARLCTHSAIALSLERNDSLALKFAYKGLALAENSKDGKYIHTATELLGEVYQNIDQPLLAIEYMRKAIPAEPDKHLRDIYTGNLGSAFCDAQQYDSALFFLKKLDARIPIYGNSPWPMNHYYLGNVYLKEKNYGLALQEYRTADVYARQSHLTIDRCQADQGIANVFKISGSYDSALLYAKQSLTLSKQYSFPDAGLAATTLIASIYESKGMTDSAFTYQKRSDALKDSLFNTTRINQAQTFNFNEKLRLREVQAAKDAFKNKINLYGLIAALLILGTIALFQVKNIRQKIRANKILKKTLTDLQSTQAQLIQSEKMASLGELTAGIAHEIQNPLNFVNNFSEVNKELVDELQDELTSGNTQQAILVAKDIKENEEKINHHGKRADAIVKSMLLHSRSGAGIKELTDINALCDEYLRLSYLGIRAKQNDFTAILNTQFDPTDPKINIVPQDIGRVLLNLCNNAFYSVAEKKKRLPQGYEPIVSLTTTKTVEQLSIIVRDNGSGVSQKTLDKIFQPFFTTKPTGQGTGLGLSLSYDIVKAHGGDIQVDTREGEYAVFTVILPA